MIRTVFGSSVSLYSMSPSTLVLGVVFLFSCLSIPHMNHPSLKVLGFPCFVLALLLMGEKSEMLVLSLF